MSSWRTSSVPRGCFSQNALLWFEVLPDAQRFVAGAPRCCAMQCEQSPGRLAACNSPSEAKRFCESHQSRPEHPGVSDGNQGCWWCIEALQWHITVKATRRGVNEMLEVRRLLHQVSHVFLDLLTAVFDKELVMSFNLISSSVCSSHSLRAWSCAMLATSFWTPSPFLKLWKRRVVVSSLSVL